MKRILFFLSLLLLLSACSERTVYTTGSIYGTATDAETGAPLPDCDIMLSPLKLSTITENDGTFRFPHIEDGQYTVRANKIGYTAVSKDMTVISDKENRIDFVLHKAAPTKGSICGTVADAATGTPLSGCSVILQPNELSATTTNDGYYQFGDLEPGEYTLLVSKARYKTGSQSNIAVKVGETCTVDILLQEERLPELSDPTVSDVGFSSVKFAAAISDEGSSQVTECGFVYGFSPSSLSIDSGTRIRAAKVSVGKFYADVSGLQPEYTYYVVAYAINAAGVAYSADAEFTTSVAPPSNVLHVSATTGNDNNDGKSWFSAKQTIKVAVAIASEDSEIWVAGESIRRSDYIPDLPNGISIYGGFAGVEISREERPQNKRTNIYGGVHLLDGPKISVVDGFIISNSIASAIRPLVELPPNGILRNCELRGNGASIVNGGRVENCTFYGNYEMNPPGVALLVSHCTVVNSTFHYNWYSAKPEEDTSEAVLINCLLFNNQNLHMAAAYNCTIVNNEYVYVGSAYNTILWNNQTAVVPNSENCYLIYGNDNSSMGFVYPYPTSGADSQVWTACDWTLTASSPCIDKGNTGNYPIEGSPTDLAGNPRISNGTIDIGAYEYQH